MILWFLSFVVLTKWYLRFYLMSKTKVVIILALCSAESFLTTKVETFSNLLPLYDQDECIRFLDCTDFLQQIPLLEVTSIRAIQIKFKCIIKFM